MSLSIRYWLAERHIDITQVGHSATPVAGVSFRIAQEMDVKSLTTFDIATLVEVLELPLTPAVQVIEPIAQITIGLLRTLSHKKPLKRNEGTWLTFQIAYLKALQAILQQELQLRRPWCDRACVPSLATDEPLNDSQLQVLLKTLRPGRLSDSQAEQALSQVGDSFLVQQMNQLTQAWFIANGAEETEAKLLVQRLIDGLPGYLLAAIAENPLPLAQLQKFVRVGNLTSREYGEAETSTLATIPVDPDRERIRASLLQSQGEPLLGELFSLKDIYVPLQGAIETQEPSNPESVDLMDWALSQLEDLTKIAVIEADSGCGKTSFCQMLACRVAQDLYPAWFPLLIRLKDVTLGQTLEQTLGPFEVSLSTPCLLILDGLDDLPRSPNPARQLEVFWQQLAQFQANSQHKILLTRHPSQDKLALSVAKIRILPMGQEEFRQWFKHWARLQSKAIAQSYFSFLKNAKVFQVRPELKDLAHRVSQPLMLYLLGILHRDGLFDESILKLNSPQLEFAIYERIYAWLLGDSDSAVMPGGRKGLAHAYRSSEAIANLRQDRSSQSLRADFQTLALSLLQTGRVTAIQSKERMPALFFKERKKGEADNSNYVLEFSHTNFKDYLGGVEIATRLIALTDQQTNRYQGISFVISSPVDVAQTLYQTLGYGILPSAIQDTIIERLRQAEHHHPNILKVLFDRLYSFYQAYCLGRWLDEGIAHHVYSQLQTAQNPLTVLQVDAAVGLNIFSLLCAIAPLAKIPFTPCGNPNLILEFDPDRLLTLMGRISVLSPFVWQQVKPNLSHTHLVKARLNRAWLSETNLQGANLSSAELIETNLSNANLTEANLTWANLAGANLSGANLFKAKLEGADLSGANLLGANLREANLTNACLFQTRLDEESKVLSTINMAIFSPTEFEDYRRSIPPLTEGFAETNPGFQVYIIESAEGEPMLPDDATIQVNPEKPTAYELDSNSNEDDPTVYLENSPKDSLWTTDLNNTDTTLFNEPPEDY